MHVKYKQRSIKNTLGTLLPSVLVVKTPHFIKM